jgi:flagellar hook-length control protein FliK
MAQNALASKDRKASLSASLDRMNDKFFMQDRSSMATDRMTAQAPMEASQLVDKLSFEKAQGYPVLQPNLKGIPNSKTEMMPQDPNLTQMSQDQQGEDPMKTLMAKLSAVGASAAALGEAAGAGKAQSAQGSNVQGGPEGQSGASGLMGLSGLTGSAAAAITSGNENSGFGSESSDESDGGDFSRTEGLEGLGRGHEGMKTEGKLGFQELLQASTAPVAGGKNNEATNANIEKLMNQAQIIARKGGGEATIRMTPEGLGQVELRVIVKDGRVNVEMATETKEAKKMIESSLSDLKMGLAGHKLSLDSLKVDTSLQSSADQLSQQQKNPDQRPDQGRDQARQMFQQFRDDNLSRREPFFEMSGSKAYRTSSRVADPLSPATEAKVQRTVEGRGERMNLVA